MMRKIMRLICMVVSFSIILICPCTSDASDEDRVIIDFESAGSFANNGARINTDIYRLGSASATWNPNNSGGNSITLYSSVYNYPTDWSGYNYLNQLLYSSKNTGKKVYIAAFTGEWYSENPGTNRYALTVDWEGWKVVSIPYKSVTWNPYRNPDWKNIYSVLYNARMWNLEYDADSYLCIDKVWLSKTAVLPNAVKTAPLFTGKKSITENRFEFEFNNLLLENQDDVFVSLTRNKGDGDEQIDVNTRISGNKLYVELSSFLEFSSQYTLKIGKGLMDEYGQEMTADAIYTFSTTEPQLIVQNQQIKESAENPEALEVLPDSGSITAVTEVTNILDEDRIATQVLAIYDIDTNEMLGAQYEQFIIPANVNNPVQISAVINLDDLNGYIPSKCYARAFVWDTVDEMTPLLIKYVSLTK